MTVLQKPPKNSKELPLCFFPWFEICVVYTGEVFACCWNNTVMGNVYQEDVARIWNAKQYQQLRKNLATGDVSGTACAECAYRLIQPAQHYPSCNVQAAEIMKNFQLSEYLFHKSEISLTSRPVSYRMDFTDECNLRCKMCYQDHQPKKIRFPRHFIENLFQERFYEHAGSVVLVGGEPLVVAESVEFIQRFAKIGPGECQLVLSTNGLLLDRFWSELKSFRRVLFAISLDSCIPQTYESIRVGSRWSWILKNLEEIEQIRYLEPSREWKVMLANIVMKSTILQLSQMLGFGESHKFDLYFGPIGGLKNKDENIYVYNWLLDTIPNWKQSLDEAIELTEAMHLRYPTKLNIMGLRKLLEARPWVTKRKASLVCLVFGGNALQQIYVDKIKRCLFLQAKISLATKFLLVLERSELKCQGKIFTQLIWESLVYPLMLTTAVVLSPCKYIPRAVRRCLKSMK